MDFTDISLSIMLGIAIILGLIMFGVIIYSIINSIYLKTLSYDSFESTAIVAEKEYVEAHSTTRLMPIGKIFVPSTTHHDAEYNVYVEYNGDTFCIDNMQLYNKVNISDVIPVIIEEGYNKHGELKYIDVDVK